MRGTYLRRVTLVPEVSAADRLALTGFAAVLMLAAVGALGTLPSHGPAAGQVRIAAADIAAPAAAGLPKVQDGRVLTRFADAGFLGIVLDGARSNVLHVVVPRGSRPVDCNVIEPAVHVTEQSASDVRLVVTGYQYVPRASAAAGGTTCVTAGSTSLPVELAAPLGDRRVYEGSAPEATTVADPADLPQPVTLPKGYRAHSTNPVTPAADDLVGERSYVHGDNQLVVRVGSRYDVLAEGDQRADATVDGHVAAITDGGAGRCVTWTELSGRVRQVCSTGTRPLATTTLLTVARSLR